VVPLDRAVENFRRSYIDKALRQNDFNRTKTAEDLGVNPRTIFRHLEKLESERRGEPTVPADGAEYDEDGTAP
jgi:DNA-binding NtrC family response regulator